MRPRVPISAALGIVVLAATVGSSVLAPAGASAGQLHVFQCQTPTGRNVPLENLSLDFGGLSFIGADNTCGSEGGVVGLWLGSLPRNAGQRVRATLQAPYGGFTAVEVTRRVRTVGGTSWGDTASPYWGQFKDSPLLDADHSLEFCAWSSGCTDRNWNGGGGVTSFPFSGGARQVIWEVGCGGSPGGGCAPGANGESRATGLVTAVHMVISESSPPSGVMGGPASQTVGVHRGTEALAVDASDLESGVYEVRAKLDDTVVARAGVGGACADQGNIGGADLDFERTVPCPMSRRYDLAVDTTKVPDGRRTLQVIVRDAAGNESTLPGVAIDIDNVPPPKALRGPVITSAASQLTDLRPGDALTVSDGTWEGTNLRFSYQWQRSGEGGYSDIPNARLPRYELGDDDIGHQVRVVVTATNAEGTTTALSNASGVVKSGATVRPQSLAPTSTKVEGSPQLVVDREQRSVQVARNAKIVVTGRLVDADGQPIADAEVEVFEQVSVVGSPWQRIAVVRTDGQGGYSYRPTTTGSRTLRFAYAARRDSGDYRATREVVISVFADMRVRAVPRVVKRGGVFKLRGRVMVDPLPPTGTWVEVQVLDAGVWRTVGTRRTSANGRWTFRHRVQRVSGVTFTFRARLRPTADVPAAESKSAPVKVRVR